jgi:hypothetical protein
MYPVIITILFLVLSVQKLRRMLSVNIFLTAVLLLAFFIGIIEQFNIEMFYINLLTEGLIFFLLIDTYIACSNKKLGFNVPGLKIFLIFTFALIISMFINSSNLYQSYLYYRFFLTPYLLMLIIVNIPLAERSLRKIVDFIQYLFIFQLIATIVKLVILGTPEHPVGTIIVAGGGVATYIPLIAAGFLISKYYIYEKKKSYLILLLLFPLIAYASQKRGTFFFLPVIFLFFVYMLGKIDIKSRAFHKKVRYTFLLLGISLLVLIVASKKINIMNPEGTKNGSFNPNFLFESSVQYNSLEGEYTYGRYASFIMVNKVLANSKLKTQLFGFGAETLKGSTRGDGRFEAFGVGGTYPGISYQFIQSGFLGGGLWLLMLYYYGLMIFRTIKKEQDRYWKSIGMGSLVLIFIFFVDHLTYSITFITVYAFTFTVACSFGLIMRRYYQMNAQIRLPGS